MLATVKKKPKKKLKNQQPSDEETKPKPSPPSKDVTNKKTKKTVKVKTDSKKKIPKSESETVSSDETKNDVKKIEAKAPIDARVIDAVYEESVPTIEPPIPKKVEQRDERINYLTGKGTQHPVHELIQNLRNLLLNSGFNELENSFFVADTDITKQFKVNPNLMFDKVYYLAESQRPVIALEQNDILQLQSVMPNINIERLVEILNEYKDNKIENYQLFQRLMNELKLNNEQITKILEVIPGLNESNLKLTNITLRSTMASSWFTTLAAIIDKENLPIKIFSTGIWFKRGPKLNELKLSSHYGASLVIMDDKISVSNGKVIAEEILNRLGFKDLKFKRSAPSQNFNVTTNEIKIFIDGIDIATCGMFNEEVLNDYDIDIPGLYINFGLEHMVMVQKGFDDIRELMYPQFYKAWKLDDGQIAEALQFILKPRTELGKTIATELVKICEQNGNVPAPCEFTVFDGKINPDTDLNNTALSSKINPEKNGNKRLIVKVFKHDKDSKLCGPAYLNEIRVKDGDIFSVPVNDQNAELAEAQHTNIRYLDAFSKLVGSTIEGNIEKTSKDEQNKISIGIIKDMEDINLQLDGGAYRYLKTNNKKIEVRGPMFVNVEWDLEKPEQKKNNAK
jgi:O-phosphoseryl-tRNA synthetase